jgi:hypothetical protein
MKNRPRCKLCKEKMPKQMMGRPRSFCSRACRQKAYRKRVSDPSYEHNKIFRQCLRADSNRSPDSTQAAIKYLTQRGWIIKLKPDPERIRDAKTRAEELVAAVKARVKPQDEK